MAPAIDRPGLLHQLDEQDIDRRKAFVGFMPDDLRRIARVRPVIEPEAGELATAFFEFLRSVDDSAPLFRKPNLLAEGKRLKQAHIVSMVQGQYGLSYAQERLELGLLYSRGGLDVRLFLGAYNELMRLIGNLIMHQGGGAPDDAFQNFTSLKKLAFFDLGLIIDVLIAERERLISAQQDAIRALSTPVLQVRDRMLVLPIIGIIDTQRAKQLTESLLLAIRANRAKVAVMDITGVAAVDSKVANHLIQTVAAARLMGAHIIVTGLSADVAQALVALGVDLGALDTVGDLQGGLEEAEQMLGYRVLRGDDGK